MFGFLVGFEDSACALALGATREKVHFSPARDFILLGEFVCSSCVGQDDSHKFLVPFEFFLADSLFNPAVFDVEFLRFKNGLDLSC